VASVKDERRKRAPAKGGVEAICTMCEVEGRPYVHANDEYVVASTPDRRRETHHSLSPPRGSAW